MGFSTHTHSAHDFRSNRVTKCCVFISLYLCCFLGHIGRLSPLVTPYIYRPTHLCDTSEKECGNNHDIQILRVLCKIPRLTDDSRNAPFQILHESVGSSVHCHRLPPCLGLATLPARSANFRLVQPYHAIFLGTPHYYRLLTASLPKCFSEVISMLNKSEVRKGKHLSVVRPMEDRPVDHVLHICMANASKFRGHRVFVSFTCHPILQPNLLL